MVIAIAVTMCPTCRSKSKTCAHGLSAIVKVQVKMEKLKRYNAWGTVTVNAQEITVILTAMTTEGKPVNRTVRQGEHLLTITGTDIIAVDIKTSGQEIAVRPLGEHDVTSHPDVKRMVKDAIDWIRESADL